MFQTTVLNCDWLDRGSRQKKRKPVEVTEDYDVSPPLSVNRGFHVTSYQAYFATHHIRDRHVSFLFAPNIIGENNKMFDYFLFSSYQITKLQPEDENITGQTYSFEISNPNSMQ